MFLTMPRLNLKSRREEEKSDKIFSITCNGSKNACEEAGFRDGNGIALRHNCHLWYAYHCSIKLLFVPCGRKDGDIIDIE